MIRIKNDESDKMETSIYKLLDWIETEAPRSIRPFWTCVFTENMLTRYPTLKRLQERLFNGQKPAVDIVKGAGPEPGFEVRGGGGFTRGGLSHLRQILNR